MIEIVERDRCIACDRCVEVCPTNVFDTDDAGIPFLARQQDCQTCFLCEAYCPADALFVAPRTSPRDTGTVPVRLGGYREAIGWGRGRLPGARVAVGPPLPAEPPPRLPAPAPRHTRCDGGSSGV